MIYAHQRPDDLAQHAPARHLDLLHAGLAVRAGGPEVEHQHRLTPLERVLEQPERGEGRERRADAEQPVARVDVDEPLGITLG
jgi:hypothetical protein